MEILINIIVKKMKNVMTVNVNKFDNYKFFYLTSIFGNYQLLKVWKCKANRRIL